MEKCAIIYGASGQDGSYLSEFLLDKGYFVVAYHFHYLTQFTQVLEEVVGKTIVIINQ